MEIMEIHVNIDGGERLDYYLSKTIPGISRTYVQKMIKEGLVLVNGKQVKPRYLVKKGDLIKANFREPEKLELIPEDIPIDIIFQDEDLLVVNKPKGMVVHPAPGNPSGTLVNALLYHVSNLSSIESTIRPGIIHRLDKDTSGLLIVAKNDKSHKALSKQLKNREIKRIYTALVYGRLDKEKAVIDAPIGRHPINRKRMAVVYKNSKEAITHYRVLEYYKDYTLVEASLETGRTHQIRVHMAYINHPVVGDPVYSNRKSEFGVDSQLLHARQLGFYHPRSGEYMEFESELPKDFKKIIQLLEKRNR
ncbi:RluA family pseudouridine synthase [Clostridium sp. Cult3]|uniref:RluA family pseudouridine synthase n=1 Tax=Clostridium sp. Cult3 TaxID=2079004 RepID=UPI001F3AE4B6|nr:RluA family pseudouridine synthase [Clostridium sp. Cult3]MCF6461283.1 RNA pseudouridine synthase [Clostridium sp. Cult3]